MSTSYRIAAGLLVCFGLVGCDGPGTGDVSGVITYKGVPLKSGQVVFLPEGGTLMAAEIGADGRYTIAGVPEGNVKIGVSVVNPGVTQHFRDVSAGSKDSREAKGTPKRPTRTPTQFSAVPVKYGDANGSGLTYEVKPGTQTHNIELQ